MTVQGEGGADVARDDEWIATARLLRRTGFGTTGREVDAAVAAGRSTYLSQILASNPYADGGARATPAPRFDPMPAIDKSATKAQKAAHNQQLGAQTSALTAGWLRRMVAVQRPFDEKLTFLWHNHFATSDTLRPRRRRSARRR